MSFWRVLGQHRAVGSAWLSVQPPTGVAHSESRHSRSTRCMRCCERLGAGQLKGLLAANRSALPIEPPVDSADQRPTVLVKSTVTTFLLRLLSAVNVHRPLAPATRRMMGWHSHRCSFPNRTGTRSSVR
jgi:hypothetical protein